MVEAFGIYRDLYKSTIWEKHLGMSRGRGAWAQYSGDIPVATIGGPHNGFSAVVNSRGNLMHIEMLASIAPLGMPFEQTQKSLIKMMKVAFKPYLNNPPDWKVVSWKQYSKESGYRTLVEIFAKTEQQVMNYIREELTVLDTDSSGTDEGTVGIKFDDGTYKFYKYVNEFYWLNWNDMECRSVENEMTFTEISAEEAGIALDRDWLRLPYYTKWPPHA